MENITLKVDGMSCQHCVKAVEGALKALDGVAEVKVDLALGTAEVRFNSTLVGRAQMKEAIEDQGYDVA